MHSAAARGDVGAIARQRSYDCVNARNRFGWRPIHAAVRHGRADAVDALIAAGADVSLPAYIGPLKWYSTDSDLGARTSSKGRNTQCASQKPPPLCAESSVESAIYTPTPDTKRSVATLRWTTALHLAAERNDTAVARRLLDAGADARRRDSDGRTPADVAAACGWDVLAGLLTPSGGEHAGVPDYARLFSARDRAPMLETLRRAKSASGVPHGKPQFDHCRIANNV